MNYTLRGHLCGYICGECWEHFANMKVRLYRTRDDQRVTALAVASPKDTFAILSDDQVAEKDSSLLGEFDTDAAGEFVAVLGDEQGYDGGPFEVDVYCTAVPGRTADQETEARAARPVQFSITVLQPIWGRGESGALARWDYCLSYRYWCLLRARFDAWVICGRVLVVDSKVPAAGVKVLAYDADWLQDDPLGSGITDSNGRFRIDYQGSAYRKDIFGLNIELFGGPDVYFRIETPSGSPLLTEPSSRARAPDRENVPHCFCTDLFVKEAPVITHAWFTRVGRFSIYSDINHLGDGLTAHAVPVGFAGAHGGPGFGFFGALKLVGDCPTAYPTGGPPMRYRFLYDAGAGEQPIVSADILPIAVGTRPVPWDVDGNGVTDRPQDIYVAPSGATPPGLPSAPSPLPPPGTPWGPIPPAVIVPDAQGWVTVDPLATNQGFSGPLLWFNSASVVPGGAAPGAIAGSLPGDPKEGRKIRIIFEAEPNLGADISHPTLRNQLSNIMINNWSDVNELDLQQFHASGATSCSALTNDLDIEYTAQHELLAGWSLALDTAATVPGGTPAPLTGSASAAATLHLNISTWPPCSYRVTLSTWRKLTDGENDDSGHTNLLTFCKD